MSALRADAYVYQRDGLRLLDRDHRAGRRCGRRASRISVAGMTCGGCASRVSKHLGMVAGVSDVSDVASGAVSVTSAAALDTDTVAAAVTSAGYQLVR